MTHTALVSVIPLVLAFVAVFRLPYRARQP
jgi:hypothetical protein